MEGLNIRGPFGLQSSVVFFGDGSFTMCSRKATTVVGKMGKIRSYMDQHQLNHEACWDRKLLSETKPAIRANGGPEDVVDMMMAYV